MRKVVLSLLIFFALFCLLPTKAAKSEAKILTAEGTLKNVKKAPVVSGHFVTKKSKKYYLQNSGKYLKNVWLKYDGKYYYLTKSGKMHTGWLIYNGQKYYLNKNGNMLTGWQKISGAWYCLKSNGTLNTGIKASQYILVRSSGSAAKVYMLEQLTKGKWKQLLGTSGFIGRNGVTNNKKEGDGKTPKGTYSFGRAFGVKKNPGTLLTYTKVNSSHYWVDDPSSKYYNQFVSTKNVTKDWYSAEHLIDYSTAYAYAVAVNYNVECVPGKGSAIFLHCQTGRPTAGCIAVSKKMMVKILKNINDDALICIQ